MNLKTLLVCSERALKDILDEQRSLVDYLLIYLSVIILHDSMRIIGVIHSSELHETIELVFYS